MSLSVISILLQLLYLVLAVKSYRFLDNQTNEPLLNTRSFKSLIVRECSLTLFFLLLLIFFISSSIEIFKKIDSEFFVTLYLGGFLIILYLLLKGVYIIKKQKAYEKTQVPSGLGYYETPIFGHEAIIKGLGTLYISRVIVVWISIFNLIFYTVDLYEKL